MDLETRQKFTEVYQAGQQYFERGQYDRSIASFQAACQLVERGTKLGGEVQMWLVTAYQAGGKQEAAIELCEELLGHPHQNISKKSKDLLYIIKAPRLKRPKEWLTEIPDLGNLADNNDETPYKIIPKNPPNPKKNLNLASLPTGTISQDHTFIWLALVIILLVLGSIWIMNNG